MPTVASAPPHASHGSQVGGTLARVANSGQFVNRHCPLHVACQSGCVLRQSTSLHWPVVIHLSQIDPSPVALRMEFITGRQTAFAAVFSGSLSELYMRDISSRGVLPNRSANGWNLCSVLPFTTNGCLSEPAALPGGDDSGGGHGCWPDGSMPALRAGLPWCWCGLCWLLRCGSGGGCCVGRPWSFAARGVGGDAAHHGGGCIIHAGSSVRVGLAAAGAGAGDVAGGGW